jgi:hypothetical protein
MNVENWIIAVTSDGHTNSRVGLWPRQFTLDDGQIVTQSPGQAWLWEQWLAYWERVALFKKALPGARVLSVLNGDAVDKNKHSGYQLATENEDDIIDAAVAVCEPMLAVADEIAVVRGTEAHTGGSGWMEEQLAKEIATVKPSDKAASWWWFPVMLGGVYLGFSHHPGTNSMVRWTNGNAANRAAAAAIFEYFGETEYPQLITYGHVHHAEDSSDNHPIRAMFLPPFKLSDSYDNRSRSGRRVTVGGNIYVVSGGKLRVDKVRIQSEREEPVRL